MSTKMAQKTANSRNSFQSTQSAVNSVVRSEPVQNAIEWARDYVKENPESAALWCFGIGFVLAWKLKPW